MILCGRCVETVASVAKAFFHTNGMSETVISNSVSHSDARTEERQSEVQRVSVLAAVCVCCGQACWYTAVVSGVRIDVPKPHFVAVFFFTEESDQKALFKLCIPRTSHSLLENVNQFTSSSYR